MNVTKSLHLWSVSSSGWEEGKRIVMSAVENIKSNSNNNDSNNSNKAKEI